MNYRKILLIASFIPLSCMGASVIEWPDVPDSGWNPECGVSFIEAIRESARKDKEATINQLKRIIARDEAEYNAMREFIRKMDDQQIFNIYIENSVRTMYLIFIDIDRNKRWLHIAENEKEIKESNVQK